MLTPKNVRGEHLLWLTPVLYIWVANITAPIQTIVVFNDGIYYLLSYFTTAVIFLSVIGLPYFLHKYFRKNKTRSIVVSWMHILSSVIIMFTILLIYTYTPPIDREWRYYPLLRPNFARWRLFNDIAIILFVTLILVQVTYLIYGFGKLFQQKRAGLQQSNTSGMELYQFSQNAAISNPAL
jgi:hypothetical protein